MSAKKWRALIVDDDPDVQRLVASVLGKGGFDCVPTDSATQALEALEEQSFDLLLIDRKLPDTDGVHLLRQLRAQGISTAAIIITAHPSVPTAVGALQSLAFDYLQKPFDTEELLAKAQRALASDRVVDENLYLWETLAATYGWRHVLSRSPQAQRAYIMAAQAAPSRAPVVIEGETGVGKEYLAHAIHYMSDRADRPFVPLNCGGFPDELLENELFGHEKGAFTSANAAKAGLCEIADGGTLFLDEISQMSPTMQIKLLRFVEDRTFTRLGGTEPRQVEVRIIAATNQPLPEMLESGRFREDLYYRLNVIPLHLPALRARPEDIKPFVAHFLAQFDVEGRKQIAEPAWDALKAYTWPGNLRELRNVIQRAVVLAVADTLEEKHLLLGAKVRAAGSPSPSAVQPADSSALPSLEEVAKQHILTVLAACDGDKGAAAEILGISRSTLNRRLTEYGR